MNDERYDPLWHNADATDPYYETGTGRHRAGAVYAEPVDPTVPPWDPAEELAYLLQEARAEEYAAPRCHHRARSTPPRSPASRGDLGHRSPVSSPMGNLQEITASLPPLRSAPRAHRKPPRPRPDALRVASYAIAAMAAVTVSMVSVFSGVVTYEPLLLVTTAHSSGDSSSWWPILVYGPWLAWLLLHPPRRPAPTARPALLVRRPALLLRRGPAVRGPGAPHRHRHGGRGLPGVAALACFQQLVRQITLTRPPRRTVSSRHRVRPYGGRQVP